MHVKQCVVWVGACETVQCVVKSSSFSQSIFWGISAYVALLLGPSGCRSTSTRLTAVLGHQGRGLAGSGYDPWS